MGDGRALYQLVAYRRPRRVLEIGTYGGVSTLYFATAARRFSPDGAKVTSVDIVDVNGASGPWKYIGLYRPPVENAALLELGDTLEFRVASSEDYLASSRERFDLIFLDGDHSPAVVYRELSLAFPLLAPGGVVLLHDYYPDGRPFGGGKGKVIRGPFTALRRIRSEGVAVDVVPFGVIPGNAEPSTLAAVVRL
jgi:predicted O-methyltransferase YrrM